MFVRKCLEIPQELTARFLFICDQTNYISDETFAFPWWDGICGGTGGASGSSASCHEFVSCLGFSSHLARNVRKKDGNVRRRDEEMKKKSFVSRWAERDAVTTVCSSSCHWMTYSEEGEKHSLHLTDLLFSGMGWAALDFWKFFPYHLWLRDPGEVMTRTLEFGRRSLDSGIHRSVASQHWAGPLFPHTLTCILKKTAKATPTQEAYHMERILGGLVKKQLSKKKCCSCFKRLAARPGIPIALGINAGLFINAVSKYRLLSPSLP